MSMQIGGYHVWPILLTCTILQVAAVTPSEARTETNYRSCTELWRSSQNDVVHASKPGNVTIIQEGTTRDFSVTWTSTALSSEVPDYFVIISPAEPTAVSEKIAVCFAFPNDDNRKHYVFKSRLALNDGNPRLKSNTTIRVTVSSSLTLRRDTYRTFLVRIPYPPPGDRLEFVVLPPEAGFKSLMNWSTPMTMSLLPNCTVVVGFIEAPSEFNVPKYGVTFNRIDAKESEYLSGSHSPIIFDRVEPGKYQIQLMPSLTKEEKALGRTCLCGHMGRCYSCLSITSTPIVILSDNSTKGGCVALPEPVSGRPPPIVEVTPPLVWKSEATTHIVPVIVVVSVILMLCALMGFIWMLHRNGKRHLTYLIGDRGRYEALLIHAIRDGKLARSIRDWLVYTRKTKLRTKMVTVCRTGLFEPSVAELCYHLEHVRFVIILSSQELLDECETESPDRHVEFIRKLKLKFVSLNDSSCTNTPDGGELRLEQMFSLTTEIDENHAGSVFPRIVPYLVPHHVSEIAGLVRSDVPLNEKRVKKMAACISDVYDERERKFYRAAMLEKQIEETDVAVQIPPVPPAPPVTQNGHPPCSNGDVCRMNILTEEPPRASDNRSYAENFDQENETLLVRQASEIST